VGSGKEEEAWKEREIRERVRDEGQEIKESGVKRRRRRCSGKTGRGDVVG